MPLPNPSTSDIFIPILGVTGVGKSTFINDAAGKVVAPINDDVTSDADPIKTIIVAHPHDPTRRITFVDTPGFDDTYISDEEILRRIVDWLESSCSAGIKLAGVVYLHDITRTRLHETYKMLAHRLAAHNFILATTKWNEPEKDAERKRERQLSEKFWKGSNVPRFMHTTESAWEIVDLILQMPPLDTPQFRKTLKSRPQTGHATPSRYLSRFLRRLFDQHQSATLNHIVHVPNPSTSDIFIPILGVTGVGKSTFINVAAGGDPVPDNDNLDSEAGPIKTVIVTHPRDPTCRITLVDTPGFDDTYISDEEILRRIVDWLESSCSEGIKLAGVVYLHDITRTRLHETYNTLARRLAPHNFVLATTKWNKPEKDAERKREQQLSEKFWKGSNLPRFMHTTKSAWAIIDLILQMPPLETPQTWSDFHRRPQKVQPTPSRYLSRFVRKLFISELWSVK